MRHRISAGVVVALALLIPAAPAAAQPGTPGLNAACQTVEREAYKDVRQLVTLDLDTATDTEVRVLANQILAAAEADSLPVLPDALQARMDGTPDELRAFLRTGVQTAWLTGLRVSVVRTLTGAGTNVRAAAQKVLDDGTVDAFLAYLNDGLYAARALDCASQPTPTPSVTPGATTGAPTPTSSAGPSATVGDGGGSGGSSGGEDGGLPVTGAAAGTVAGIGGALLLLGGAGYLIGRRRRSRFVA
ncbi:ALF repeat-containing protein [Couchioplanes caeruleus]|uniref:LPXTG cell wall anchor domain-containing protein n=1 Tax=Couchioplanes caeruleus TaxID=56438 RepID=UPI0020C14DBF|nr:LPXTG cell wall anchor domain-containing protein [Couchioplanes caeruleus]UQU66545.1 ALF repeat-containing protein [Couchioplanes caeruleus]